MFSLSRHSRPGAIRRITIFTIASAFVVTVALTWAAVQQVSGQITLTDINPNQSSLDPTDPDGASGGRINGLASVVGNNQRFYAATEWGGIYTSNDGGLAWNHLDNHRPTVTWDVEVSPTNQNLVIATSFYDGRVNSIAGINVSNDGGNTWTHPATSVPPTGFCSGDDRREEPSAFGISIDPANPQNIYVGTNCGLAISTDSGATWQFVDPTPGDQADDVWDVVAHGGIIDTFGDDGHQRSTDGGTNWTTAALPLPSGQGSIAASPDEANVIFVSTGQNIFESDNGGATWTNLGTPDGRRQGRVDFVTTNDRAGNAFDLWFGDVSIFRAGCTSNPAGGGLRCPVARTGAATSPPPAGWAGPFTRNGSSLPPPVTQRAHDDAGDIVFDTQAANDACPRLFSSDGGVYFNTLTMGPGCQNPAWEQPNITPHALWLFALDGADQAGATAEDLYFGLQDNGTYASTNAGLASPTWTNVDCCDGHDMTADSNRVVSDVCCGLTFFARNAGMTGGAAVNLPSGNVPIFRFSDAIDRFDNNSYVIATSTGIFITTSITAGPAIWTEIGAATSPPGPCAMQATGPAANPTFYAHAGRCNGDGQGTFWRYTGTAPGNAWQQVNPPGNVGGFGIIAADPNNPNRIIASHLNGSNVNMVLSTDGGANWTVLAALDNLMTAGGEYRYRNRRGLTINEGNAITDFLGYPQPSFVAFDPADGNTIIAGGADSGIFLSRDGGNIWQVITDNSGGLSNPHLPRPRFAYFDHEGGTINIYIGTQGRGVWRASLQDQIADLAITKTAVPNPAVTGTNIIYTINLTNNGPDAAQSVTVVDNLPPFISFVSCTVVGGIGGACSGVGNNRMVTFTSLAANAVATITLVANVSCALADGVMIGNSARVSSLAGDPNLANNSAMVITVASNPPPIITLNPPISLWPPNHNHHTVTIAQMVASVSDNCPLADEVVIEKVTSDEPENALGAGNTVSDIVIASDCRSVELRAERAGPNNGRVYTITLRLSDSGGAVTRKDFEVSVPKSQNGVPAVKGATALTVVSGCP